MSFYCYMPRRAKFSAVYTNIQFAQSLGRVARKPQVLIVNQAPIDLDRLAYQKMWAAYNQRKLRICKP